MSWQSAFDDATDRGCRDLDAVLDLIYKADRRLDHLAAATRNRVAVAQAKARALDNIERTTT